MSSIVRERPFKFRIPKSGRMRVDGVVYASDEMMASMREAPELTQVRNVAELPGIVEASIAMPDIHWGYGFPIGGVAAFDSKEGIISPGGVGYDINCGVRLLRTAVDARELTFRAREEIVEELFRRIPCGVGSKRSDLELSERDLKRVAERGVEWAFKNGYGAEEDRETLEDDGVLSGAEFGLVSETARARGAQQLGTLGSGNHFVEIQEVAEVFDRKTAHVFGLEEGMLTVLIHTGSRGFGYQVCDDYLKAMVSSEPVHQISISDRQLCCAPLHSAIGSEYFAAMRAAANYAYVNRQIITHYVRESLERVLRRGPKALAVTVVYDGCHNIAKLEEHEIGGKMRKLCVHRKGATRAFPAHRPELSERYRETGHPILVPGDMGRYSFVLVAEPLALKETFGSSCHGAGRVLSRTQAKKKARGRSIIRELQAQGIAISAAGHGTVVEEMPEAYKDARLVVDVVEGAGLARKVAMLRPMGVIKG